MKNVEDIVRGPSDWRSHRGWTLPLMTSLGSCPHFSSNRAILRKGTITITPPEDPQSHTKGRQRQQSFAEAGHSRTRNPLPPSLLQVQGFELRDKI